jgi:AraC-like DNA-binding protein
MSIPRLQADFFARIAEPHLFRTMFDHLPGVYFFVKDRESRLVAASRTIFERLEVKSEAEIIGARDEDLFPPHIAKGYREDDEEVFRTGKPLLDRLEIWFDEQRNLEWCITTKIPLYGREGEIVGLMGMTRRDETRSQLEQEGGVAQVTAYVHQNVDRVLSTAELAQFCGISERTLFRKVRKVLRVTPYEMILRIRIQKAATALLKTEASVSEIARSHGFCDQSTFTQHFRKRIGMTPKQFRVRYTT